MDLLALALHLQARGISIIPLKHKTKDRPLVKWKQHQQKKLTSREINKWFSNTNHNMGLVTGAISGIVVVDSDTPEALSWAHTHLPETPMKTKSMNGEHWYYRYPVDTEKIKTFSKFEYDDSIIDLDVRGDGGYIVAPFSTHPTGFVYKEITPWSNIELTDLPIFDPDWIVQRRQATIMQKPMAALNAKILNDLKMRGPAIEGQSGDQHTFKTACYLVRDLGLSIEEALPYMIAWNEFNQPPWKTIDLSKKLASALDYGSGPISKTPKLILTSAKNLLAEPPEQFDWLWQSCLVSVGTSIIVAKPKVGKTTFARNLAVAIARGDTFLNRETKKSLVVYIAAEENREQFKKSLSHFNPESICDLYIHTGHTPPNLIECLEQYVESLKPSLIILDTMIRAINVADTNSYAEMSKALAPFQEFATRHSCHVMFIHHAGKMEREHGDVVLGSTAIFGSVDTLIMLEKRKDEIYLKTIQRYGESLEPHLLTYNKTSREHTLGNSSTEIHKVSHQDKVLKFLTSVATATESEIHDNVEGHKAVIGSTIRTLVADGKIKRTGDGKRNSPFKYSLHF